MGFIKNLWKDIVTNRDDRWFSIVLLCFIFIIPLVMMLPLFIFLPQLMIGAVIVFLVWVGIKINKRVNNKEPASKKSRKNLKRAILQHQAVMEYEKTKKEKEGLIDDAISSFEKI